MHKQKFRASYLSACQRVSTYTTTGAFSPGAVDAVFSSGSFADLSPAPLTNMPSVASFFVTENIAVELIIDQTQNGGGWVLLGSYALTNGAAAVQLQTLGANHFVVADAVRFVLPSLPE